MHNISNETMVRNQEQTDDYSKNSVVMKYKEVEIVIRLVPRVDGRLKIVDDREMERFFAALQVAITKNMPMSELANMCCLSLSTFKRRFKECIGGTPREWITSKRMELAHDMLSNSDITIAALAKLCCYNSISHFIEVFKNYYHVTPYTFRNRLNNKKAAESVLK